MAPSRAWAGTLAAVILAEFEVHHSRVFSPTRRLSLGRRHLPLDPSPGFGPLLLGAIVAVGAEDLDDEDTEGIDRLMAQLEAGQRVVQPHLRNRLQTDQHGLGRSVGRLLGGGESLELDVEGMGSPLQMTLASVYAAGQFPLGVRHRAFEVLRKGLAWRGAIDRNLFSYLAGPEGPSWSALAFANPLQWAAELLGVDLDEDGRAERRSVQRAFGDMLRSVHPDHGAEAEHAARLIADLREARRILLDA